MDLCKLFCDFATSLSRRNQSLSEDTIRYIFFGCMLRQDKRFNNYCLEVPYRNLNALSINKASELDMEYNDSKDRLFLEFKYHRNNGTTIPKPNWAGSLFNDMRRLQDIGICGNCLLVYVTDDTMHNYLLAATRNKHYKCGAYLAQFYNAKVGIPIQFAWKKKDVPATFLKSASKSFKPNSSGNVSAVKVFSRQISISNKGVVHIEIFSIISLISNSSGIMRKTVTAL